MSEPRNYNVQSLPEHMQEGVLMYLNHGVEPGSFLLAVLSNNLTQSFANADITNREYIFEWAMWLRNECPYPAWGSAEKVKTWMELKRKAREDAANTKGQETSETVRAGE